MRHFRIFQLSVVFTAYLLCCGCSDPMHPQAVQGIVLQDGKPASKAKVTFHAVGNPKIPPHETSIHKDGSFHLIPGLPVGKYQMTISLGKKGGGASIPAKYTDPEQSGLEYIIHVGNNDLGTINIPN